MSAMVGGRLTSIVNASRSFSLSFLSGDVGATDGGGTDDEAAAAGGSVVVVGAGAGSDTGAVVASSSSAAGSSSTRTNLAVETSLRRASLLRAGIVGQVYQIATGGDLQGGRGGTTPVGLRGVQSLWNLIYGEVVYLVHHEMNPQACATALSSFCLVSCVLRLLRRRRGGGKWRKLWRVATGRRVNWVGCSPLPEPSSHVPCIFQAHQFITKSTHWLKSEEKS